MLRLCGLRSMRVWLLIALALTVMIPGTFLLFHPSLRVGIKVLDIRHRLSLSTVDWMTLNKPPVKVETEDSEHVGKCVQPVLDPYDPVIMQFYKPVPAVDCSSAEKDWVYVINGTFYISSDATRRYGEIKCEFASIERHGDFSIRFASPVKSMRDGMPLLSDFFRVTCESASGDKYTNLHAGVARNNLVLERIRSYHSAGKSSLPSNKQETTSIRSSDDSSLPQSFHHLNLSVFMFGFDSLSRMAWHRLLPKSHAYFTSTMGAIELEAYNIVGDATLAALLPILTGKTEEELPEARRGVHGARPVDNHPWIWREFSKHGYLTAYAEDMPAHGTFHFRMLGFHEQPTDHFMRPFFLAAEGSDIKNPKLCWGSKPRHVNFMDWFRSLFDMYRDFPKFFFGLHTEMSHDDNNDVQALDDDLVVFLKELEKEGHLNSTLMILMSDHGARFNYVRATAQGIFEERLPYFSFRFPPWFRERHPQIIQNMLINKKRLTTPFDIHATFLDILNYSSTKNGDLRNRGISLFKEIPQERTCSHAGVTPHWCACLAWEPVSHTDPLVTQAVATAIQTINSYTRPQRRRCSELALSEITRSVRYVPNTADRSAEWTRFKYSHANLPPRSPTEIYQVSFKTLPGQGHFEVTCELDVQSRQFSVNAKHISRINRYGSQPACVQNFLPHLRPYCYCVK